MTLILMRMQHMHLDSTLLLQEAAHPLNQHGAAGDSVLPRNPLAILGLMTDSSCQVLGLVSCLV
jgi:hypothetical protein